MINFLSTEQEIREAFDPYKDIDFQKRIEGYAT